MDFVTISGIKIDIYFTEGFKGIYSFFLFFLLVKSVIL